MIDEEHFLNSQYSERGQEFYYGFSRAPEYDNQSTIMMNCPERKKLLFSLAGTFILGAGMTIFSLTNPYKEEPKEFLRWEEQFIFPKKPLEHYRLKPYRFVEKTPEPVMV